MKCEIMIQMKITRKDKLDLVIMFETTEQVQLFREWVEDLISSVKRKVEQDVKNGKEVR